MNDSANSKRRALLKSIGIASFPALLVASGESKAQQNISYSIENSNLENLGLATVPSNETPHLIAWGVFDGIARLALLAYSITRPDTDIVESLESTYAALRTIQGELSKIKSTLENINITLKYLPEEIGRQIQEERAAAYLEDAIATSINIRPSLRSPRAIRKDYAYIIGEVRSINKALLAFHTNQDPANEDYSIAMITTLLPIFSSSGQALTEAYREEARVLKEPLASAETIWDHPLHELIMSKIERNLRDIDNLYALYADIEEYDFPYVQSGDSNSHFLFTYSSSQGFLFTNTTLDQAILEGLEKYHGYYVGLVRYDQNSNEWSSVLMTIVYQKHVDGYRTLGIPKRDNYDYLLDGNTVIKDFDELLEALGHFHNVVSPREFDLGFLNANRRHIARLRNYYNEYKEKPKNWDS